MARTPSGAVALPLGVTRDDRSDGSIAFSYNRAETPAEAILDAIRASGIVIADIRTEEADLEDVFLSLTGSAAQTA